MQDQSPARPRPADPVRSPTILLIDDDPGVLDSLRRVLSAEGWRIVTARTGEEALGRLRQEQPNLVITDLRMAGVNGWDLVFHERMERPELPIFVMTALPPEATGGADSFATEFFQKPLDLEELLAAIRRHLGS